MPVLKDLFIYKSTTVKESLKKLNQTAARVLLVVDGRGRLLGTITDGDIRRYILKGKSLDESIEDVYNRKPTVLYKTRFSDKKARELILGRKIELLPIVDDKQRVVDFVTWKQVFLEFEKHPTLTVGPVNAPVVIMAGGKGERMGPFTKILPKPLIPIGDKTIMEVIIDEFRAQGAKEYYLTLNYKAAMIESYFNYIERDYMIEFLREDMFLGTAGSLRLLKEKIRSTFIVSNCDVIVKANFSEVIKYHNAKKACLTILSSVQHHRIPHGLVHFKTGGNVTGIVEKPEYTFNVSTGVYVVSPAAVDLIPADRPYDMTDLIKSLIKRRMKVAM
ncbi:MAG: NTP transferase domain-containing protein, partial [Candidatus Omnitrophica bacterium]|nr:NTP transferase domain-containing protein [Candidatus Omnitrophota bacterium]